MNDPIMELTSYELWNFPTTTYYRYRQAFAISIAIVHAMKIQYL